MPRLVSLTRTFVHCRMQFSGAKSWLSDVQRQNARTQGLLSLRLDALALFFIPLELQVSV